MFAGAAGAALLHIGLNHLMHPRPPIGGPGGKGEKGVVIEDNYFETFDRPVLFAKSIDGLVFKNNVIRQNTDYPAFHHNKTRFRLLHTRNVKIEKNNFEDGDESVVRE